MPFHPKPRRLPHDDVATTLSADAVQPLLLAHLRAVGGEQSHAELGRWAAALGIDAAALDRGLVYAERLGLLRVAVGEPACSATRMVHL